MNVINEYASEHNLDEIALNLGCGGRPLEGWINIDNFDYENDDTSRSGSHYDLKMDLKDLDVAAGTVDKILLVHVVEHFVRWETIDLLAYFYSLLKHGGQLIVEMPDFDRCVALMQQGKNAPHMRTPIGLMNMGKTQFYGNQWDRLDYETHRYVWSIGEFVEELEKSNYRIISANHDAIFHMKGRDMLVIAEKRLQG